MNKPDHRNSENPFRGEAEPMANDRETAHENLPSANDPFFDATNLEEPLKLEESFAEELGEDDALFELAAQLRSDAEHLSGTYPSDKLPKWFSELTSQTSELEQSHVGGDAADLVTPASDSVTSENSSTRTANRWRPNGILVSSLLTLLVGVGLAAVLLGGPQRKLQRLANASRTKPFDQAEDNLKPANVSVVNGTVDDARVKSSRDLNLNERAPDRRNFVDGGETQALSTISELGAIPMPLESSIAQKVADSEHTDTSVSEPQAIPQSNHLLGQVEQSVREVPSEHFPLASSRREEPSENAWFGKSITRYRPSEIVSNFESESGRLRVNEIVPVPLPASNQVTVSAVPNRAIQSFANGYAVPLYAAPVNIDSPRSESSTTFQMRAQPLPYFANQVEIEGMLDLWEKQARDIQIAF